MAWKWLPLLGNLVARVPFEKLIIKPLDRRKDLEELQEILKVKRPENMLVPEAPPRPRPSPALEDGHLQPRVAPGPSESRPALSEVSNQETIDYQNREMGKDLLVLERHAAQKFRIRGKPCDCGQVRHFLGLEKLAEEALSMGVDTVLYDRVLDWVKRTAPKCTVEAARSGKYDGDYPRISTEARDLRKELLGTLDTDALWPEQSGEELHPKESPVETRQEV